MGMHDASGQLEKAMRNLLTVWYETKDHWSDIKMTSFEERYIVPLQQDVRLASETMARVGTIVDQMRRECSDRELL